METRQEEHIPIYDTQPPSEEGQRVITMFDAMERTQIDRVESLGSLFGRWAMLLFLVTFAGLLLSQSLLQSLRTHPFEKALLLVALLSFLVVLVAEHGALWPRNYDRYEFNATRLSNELKKIVAYKKRWVHLTTLAFVLGSVCLFALIAALVLV